MAIRIIARPRHGWPQYQFQRTEVVNDAAAAAVAYVPTDGLFRQSGTNQGLRFTNDKSSAAAVAVAVTTDPVQLALNPAAGVQTNVTWKTLGNAAAGDILVDADGLHVTAVRLTFTNIGRVTITAN